MPRLATPGRPLIVDIKRHSLEDGPGIRTIVFFKGCPLKCAFCHNPETQSPEAEIAFYPEQCIHCGLCEKACENRAIRFEDPGTRIDRKRCLRCGACAEICPARALRVVGTGYSVPELVEILLADLPFYESSGGGVTLSGGECTLFPDYLEELLKALKSKNLHVAIETSGYFHYDTFRSQILPHVDLIFADIKLGDPEAHKHFTGKSNRLILSNAKRLIENGKAPVKFRVPLIPNVTATAWNLIQIAAFLKTMKIKKASLLPYNPLGLEKWERIGKPAPDLPQTFMPDMEIWELKARLEAELNG
jgi:pyruvate formate lyase activating enzyme